MSMFWKNKDLFINNEICKISPFKLFCYHDIRMFSEPRTTDSGIVEGMRIEKELTLEDKKIQKEVQSLKINLDIIQSNAKKIKILDVLELAHKTNKNTFADFWPLLKPHWLYFPSNTMG